MKILAIEPYYKGSHKAWIDQYSNQSEHEIKLLTLPGNHWKWRMHGAAMELAALFDQLENYTPDLILFSDMMDVNLFLSLTRVKTSKIRTVLYFHENQFSYPKSSLDQDSKKFADDHYGFINYASGQGVDKIFFNSHYNKKTYLEGCRNLIRKMPDFNSMTPILELEKKCEVLPLGLDLQEFIPIYPENKFKTILWNHRWEYDKNPQEFFTVLKRLKECDIPFKLNLIGRRSKKIPQIFTDSLDYFKDEILHSQNVENITEYITILQESDLALSTSIQDFFGISTTEAICSGAVPLLPNRVALPELIPEKYHSQFLYDSEEDLFLKLKNFLTNPIPKNEMNYLIAHCKQYDWSQMAPIYDEKFFKTSSN